MGFKPTPQLYSIEFMQYPGLEVKCRSTSLGELMDVSSLNVKLNEPDPEKRMAIFAFFAGQIDSWNIDHPACGNKPCARCGLNEDDPLPITVDGILCLELAFIMQIIFGWMNAVARIPDPKGMSSNGGGMSPLDLMMQLGQLQNPMTLPEQN